MNLVVIDNFLPYPHIVRHWALSQQYYNCEEMSIRHGEKTEWPGIRTDSVNTLDINYANDVLSKISYLTQMCFGASKNLSIRSAFQLTRKEDGDSWIHKDDDTPGRHFAGLLYLTPNAPITSGTTLYTPPPHEPMDIVGNVFNRLILYRSETYHKSTEYFGDTLENGRLTQVFFTKDEKE